MYGWQFPVLEEYENGVDCVQCHVHLEGDAYYDGRDAVYCEKCICELGERTNRAAEAYANTVCKITKPLPKYDSENEFRCTPEEYEAGERESYTPNAYMCHCRHNCTNYDELIVPLDRDDFEDKIYYMAIYRRIMEILEDAIEEMEDEEVAEDDVFEDRE